MRFLFCALLLVLTVSSANEVGFLGGKFEFSFNSDKIDAKVEVPALTVDSMAISDPGTLYNTVEDAWKNIVVKNQAGLSPPGPTAPPPDLSEEEAYFQYIRTQTGQVDSARFLVVFGMIPSLALLPASTSPLHIAAAMGEEERVQQFLHGSTALVQRVPVDEERPDGTTPLHFAATMGHEKVVQLLVDEGADVHAVAANGMTPLHSASTMGHTKVIEILLDNDADVNAKHTFAGSTPLHFAAEMGHVDVIKLLCERGGDPNQPKKHGATPLHVAADSNQAKVTEALLFDCHANPNPLLFGDTTPLYLAASRGHTLVVRALCKNGANLDFVMQQGQVFEHTSEVDIPVNQQFPGLVFPNLPGSDPTDPTFEVGNGATALHVAAENGHLRAAKVLLKYGAKQLGSMEGATPLITALLYQQQEIASELLEYDANINAVHRGTTALQLGIRYQYGDVVSKLIYQGVTFPEQQQQEEPPKEKNVKKKKKKKSSKKKTTKKKSKKSK